MRTTIEMVREYLIKTRWYFDEGDPDSLVFWDYRIGRSGTFACRGYVDEELFNFSCELPDSIPENKRFSVLEFLNKHNLTICFGSLSLTEKGKVVVSHDLYLVGMQLSVEIMETFIRQTIFMADELYPIIEDILADRADPKTVTASFYTGEPILEITSTKH